MIVLDTNVISELMRQEPNDAVFAFVDAQPSRSLYTTSIVVAEILAGIAMLPAGRRRMALEDDASRLFQEEFADRILPFDRRAAAAYGHLIAKRRALGRPLEGFDGLIAAAAVAANAAIATRNVADFEGCAVALIDPWKT